VFPSLSTTHDINVANPRSLALSSAASEPEKERTPPAEPTPLDFPAYDLPDAVSNDSDSTLRGLFTQLASIKRPQDISIDRFKPLNLHVESDVEVSQMFPADQARSLPPLPWEEPEIKSAEGGEDQARPLMSNGLPYPPRDRFETLRTELALDPDDVFREVARLPLREGRSRVRVTQTRKFWTGLERMSQYWDTSIDNYFERPVTPEPTPEQTSPAEHETQTDEMHTDTPLLDTTQPDSTDGKMDVDGSEADTRTSTGSTPDAKISRPTVPMYTGRRIGAGTEMPDDVREETIRSFIEMAAWPFGCQVTVPTLPPRLTVGNLLFPVRQSFQIARSPKDRQIARQGILEGPVFIAQCRPETTFRVTGDEPGSGIGEVCDLFREVGGMLLAAQERAREGEAELRPGEGKWWTTKPRFGGAPNDGILDDLVRNAGIHIPDSMLGDSPTAEEAETASKRHKFEHSQGSYSTSLARRPSAMRKLSSGEKWKILQPGPSLWDKRMIYEQIGRANNSPYDDVRPQSPYYILY